MSPGALIREARRRAKITQAELARRLGTTQSAVARWESDRVSPRVETVARAANACGLEASLSLRPRQSEDLDQIRERLRWSPKERLDHLRDLLAFEQRTRRARRVTGSG